MLIIGGGVIGAATACFLARDHGAEVIVVERDLRFTRASSSLSASSIRQQFSTPLNIALSRWSLDFLHRADEELAVDGQAPALGLVEPGYLYLAQAEGAAAMRAAHAVQRGAGAEVALLDAAALHARFPWLHTADLALGSLGTRGEGWFDGPALHAGLRRKAAACGARFVAAEALGFTTRGDRIDAVQCRDSAGRPLTLAADAVLLAAGGWSAALAACLGLTLPVRPKKRDVFVLDSPAMLPGCPLLIDPSGVWCRPEGRGFIAGAPPREPWPGDPDEPPLEAIDHGLFDEHIWPVLAARIPAFEALRVRAAWAGYYDMNLFDHNAVVGALPGWGNAFVACGFSGHGMQHAPAVGHALAALLAGGRSTAPSLAALSPQRLLDRTPLTEQHVI